jgi:hypothetical protein
MAAQNPASRDVPAVIAGSVNLLGFSAALAQAWLVGRHDSARGLLIIEPATAAPGAVIVDPDAEALMRRLMSAVMVVCGNCRLSNGASFR